MTVRCSPLELAEREPHANPTHRYMLRVTGGGEYDSEIGGKSGRFAPSTPPFNDLIPFDAGRTASDRYGRAALVMRMVMRATTSWLPSSVSGGTVSPFWW
jgi:hypothetical protein